MKKAAFFRSGATSPEQQAKTGRQSIRGRISGPIPMPDPLEPPPDYPAPSIKAAAYAPQNDIVISEEPAAQNFPMAVTTTTVDEVSPQGVSDIAQEALPVSPMEQPSAVGTAAVVPEPEAEIASPTGMQAVAQSQPIDDAPGAVVAEVASPTGPMAPLQMPRVRQIAGTPTGHRRDPTPDLSEQTGVLPHPAQPAPALSQPIQQHTTPSPTPVSRSGPASHASILPAFHHHHGKPSSTLRYSEASAISTGMSTGGGTSTSTTLNGSPPPQRKKSTLRGALSKLFGRRKKVDSEIIAPSAAQTPETAPQHRSVRSDPTILSRPRDTESKRSASLPITEYDRALRSHSIGPDEIAAIGSARNSSQIDRTSTQVDAGGARRRITPAPDITIPNRTLYPTPGHRRFGNYSAEILSGSEWTGLSPRPASAHGRGSSSQTAGLGIRGNNLRIAIGLGMHGGSSRVGSNGALTDPSEIGRAITSDGPGGHSSDLASRRRSRSLSGINDLAFVQSQARRRSDEIRYWRESYDPAFLSPLSSGRDMDFDARSDDNDMRHHDTHRHDERMDDDDADGDDGLAFGEGGRGSVYVGDGDDDLTGAVSLLQSLPDSPVERFEEQQRQQQKKNDMPSQPFSFGNLSSVGGTASGSMDILAPANGVDGRLGGLETRMDRVERVVDQLCHSVPGFDKPLADQVPRTVPPFAGQDALGLPAMPPIPSIYQTQAATVPPRSAGDGAQTYTSFLGVSSGYSNGQRSLHSAHSFDSDMHSRMSFGEGQTFIGSLHPPSSSATQAQSVAAVTGVAGGAGSVLSAGPASSSEATVREGGGVVAGDAAQDLAVQLASERAVRQTLETQVKKLNERVNALSTTMYAMLRDPAAAKPRGDAAAASVASTSPSSSTRPTSTQIKVASVRETARALGHGPFVSDVSAACDRAQNGNATEAFPGSVDGDDDGQYNYSGDYDDADMDDDTRRQKKAARTLSLGQLTLGKSAVPT